MTAVMPEQAGALAELPAMPTAAAPILLPALLRGLGLTAPETDFEASLRLGLTEDYTAYDTRMRAATEATP